MKLLQGILGKYTNYFLSLQPLIVIIGLLSLIKP